MKLPIALVVSENILMRQDIRSLLDDQKAVEKTHFSSSYDMAMEWLLFHQVDVIISNFSSPAECIRYLEGFRQIAPNTKLVFIPEDHDFKGDSNLCKTAGISYLDMESVKDGRFIREFRLLTNKEAVETIREVQTIPYSDNQMFTPSKEFICLKAREDRIQEKVLKNPSMITIAASTGGPIALQQIFDKVTSQISIPIFIVQHIPPEFSKTLAQSLAESSGKNIIQAQDGIPVQSDAVYIAPGGFHMVLEKNMGKILIRLKKTELVNGVRPSADVFLASIAENFPGKSILNFILTGMGSDGMLGTKRVGETCNVYTICQDEASSVVFGMPSSVIRAGLADEVLGVEGLIDRINQALRGGGLF